MITYKLTKKNRIQFCFFTVENRRQKTAEQEGRFKVEHLPALTGWRTHRGEQISWASGFYFPAPLQLARFGFFAQRGVST